MEPKYKKGDIVWLKELEPPDYDPMPRELAEVLVVEGVRHHPSWPEGLYEDMYIVRVFTSLEKGDDGLREVEVNSIEDKASEEEAASVKDKPMNKFAESYLRRAGPYIGYEP